MRVDESFLVSAWRQVQYILKNISKSSLSFRDIACMCGWQQKILADDFDCFYRQFISFRRLA